MDVSIFTAFLAGLVSFLSPCVLPLVPGYISMLSGIGVEQLKEDKAPRGALIVSAIAFVLGFSVVFITFGASASAVGEFLLRNRASLAPVAGSLIILFGLHLTGLLAKITVKVGLIVGAILVVLGVALAMKSGVLGHSVKPIDFYAISLIFLVGPSLTRWLNRDVRFRNVGGQPAPSADSFSVLLSPSVGLRASARFSPAFSRLRQRNKRCGRAWDCSRATRRGSRFRFSSPRSASAAF